MPSLLQASPEGVLPVSAAAQKSGKENSGAAPRTRHAALINLAGYICVALLSFLALGRIMKLYHADLFVRWCDAPDAVLLETWVKGIEDHGWYLTNPSLGAPGGMFMHDFPMADSLHFFVLKLLVAVTHSTAAATNLYYVLGFPVAAIAAAAMMRALGVSWPPAAVASVLYSLLPYHLIRIWHLFLASYYLVPLAVLVAVWLNFDQLRWPWSRQTADAGGRRRLYCSVLILLLTSGAGIYYAFFTCYLLLVGSVVGAIHGRLWRPAIIGAALVTLTATAVLVGFSPNLRYWRQNGPNLEVAHRAVDDTEHLGLKIGQLVLPTQQHRVPGLAKMKWTYDNLPLSSNEKQFATLGVVGTGGFLFLLALLLRHRQARGKWEEVCNCLASFNIACVLLGTIGGFGSLFSLLINPSIRAYNRISVFIALFALTAVAILLDRLRSWWLGKGGRQWPVVAVCALVLIGGVIDQAGRGLVPDYAGLAVKCHGEAAFVEQIERHVKPGEMIFQLPYYKFPEYLAGVPLCDYEFFRLYLHSHGLRFSYGAMKGRAEDLWQRAVSALPIEEQLRAMRERGFHAITVFRKGYPDHAVGLEASLTTLIGPPVVVSADGGISFFMLPTAAEQLQPAAVAAANPPSNTIIPQ